MRIFVPRCSAELSGEAPDGFVVSFMPSILTSPPSEQELQRCLHHVRPRSPWSSPLAGELTSRFGSRGLVRVRAPPSTAPRCSPALDPDCSCSAGLLFALFPQTSPRVR